MHCPACHWPVDLSSWHGHMNLMRYVCTQTCYGDISTISAHTHTHGQNPSVRTYSFIWMADFAKRPSMNTHFRTYFMSYRIIYHDSIHWIYGLRAVHTLIIHGVFSAGALTPSIHYYLILSLSERISFPSSAHIICVQCVSIYVSFILCAIICVCQSIYLSIYLSPLVVFICNFSVYECLNRVDLFSKSNANNDPEGFRAPNSGFGSISVMLTSVP